MSSPPPLGISAIARRLGLSRQRVHVLAGQAGFPAPLHDLETGRVWRARDIDKWVERNPRYDHSAELERCPTCGQVVA